MLQKTSLKLLSLLVLGCSAGTGSTVKHDASTPDSAADLTTVPDSAEVANSADAPSDAGSARDGANGADISRDSTVGADSHQDALTLQDALPDGTSVFDVSADRRVPDDLAMEVQDATDQAADRTLAHDGANDVGLDSGSSGACNVASGSFQSVELHECGLTPTGTAMCNWWVIVVNDRTGTVKLTWRLHDYSLDMNGQCSDHTITASNGDGGSYVGTYDPETGTLTWDGFAYRQPGP